MAHSTSRSDEITAACRSLYGRYTFHEINLKLISSETSMSRPSIYNYFETKEEIFLAILKEEYDQWCSDLEKIAESSLSSIGDFASAMASSLSKRVLMLKIQCMNLYEIEGNSRSERLQDFKVSYARSMDLVDRALSTSFKGMDEEARRHFIYTFFPFLYGVYPYAYPTDKQLAAMKGAGMTVPALTIEGMVHAFITDILKEV